MKEMEKFPRKYLVNHNYDLGIIFKKNADIAKKLGQRTS